MGSPDGWEAREGELLLVGWEGRGFVRSLGDPLLHAGHAGGCGLWAGVPNTSPASQTLSLQRQMMENLVIAKAREETVSFLVWGEL